ncbi:MAG TPA: SDR family NAD(P)-dependent oxidoreductase [Solirubrobacteraceae bacterium]|nr:SDR family NAD(P)-dependent oxidoreductase [Solirubrobacteraceae bacterium]
MAGRIQLAGSRTLLTGATGGIGQALARRLAGEGAQLVLSGRRQDVLDALAGELGATAVACDLADPDAPDRLLERAGPIDVLIANAALPASGPLGSRDLEQIDRALAVNLRAPIALAHGLLPAMTARGSGQLVFIGSLQSRAATLGASVYCATKFGLRGFALGLRADLARSGVGVSLVMPGFVSDAGMYAEAGVALPAWIGTRTPERVAAAVVDAIAHDRAEVEVAPLHLRAGTTIAALAPETAARATRILGGERIAQAFARGQAHKR